MRLDAAACAALGVVALAAPLAPYGDTPGLVAGELALLLAVALVAVVALGDLPPSGVLLLLVTAAGSVALGLAELRLARTLR